MKKTNKIYEEQGIQYHFNSEKLQVLINQRKQFLTQTHKKATKAEIMVEIADGLYVSTEAVKNWMYGYNGPSDLEQIKTIGKYFDVDYHQLLKLEEDKMNNNVSTVTVDNAAISLYSRDKVREIYLEILEYLDRAERGYCALNAELSLNVGEVKSMSSREFLDHVGEVHGDLHCMLDGIRDDIRKLLLDIPESLYENINDYSWSRLENLMNMISSYHIDGEVCEYPVIDDGVDGFLESYFETREYMNELRDLFNDYIVK